MSQMKSVRPFALLMLVSLVSVHWLSERSVMAAAAVDSGSISGKVTADKGAVHAVRVRAKDTVRKITYTVFTKSGRYQIYNLLPGSYQVLAAQDGFKSTTQSVELGSGETKTADVALTGDSGAWVVQVRWKLLRSETD